MKKTSRPFEDTQELSIWFCLSNECTEQHEVHVSRSSNSEDMRGFFCIKNSATCRSDASLCQSLNFCSKQGSAWFLMEHTPCQFRRLSSTIAMHSSLWLLFYSSISLFFVFYLHFFLLLFVTLACSCCSRNLFLRFSLHWWHVMFLSSLDRHFHSANFVFQVGVFSVYKSTAKVCRRRMQLNSREGLHTWMLDSIPEMVQFSQKSGVVQCCKKKNPNKFLSFKHHHLLNK